MTEVVATEKRVPEPVNATKKLKLHETTVSYPYPADVWARDAAANGDDQAVVRSAE